MPVRSIITAPADGARLPAGALTVRGAAWAGDRTVSRVELSLDRGASWQPAALKPPRNRYDWQRWSLSVAPPQGAVTIMARATDDAGATQPETPELWNPGGYGGNAVHRIAVSIG